MSFSADFHLHSNHSDGSDAPARVVERAKEANLDAIALTDHDTVSGVAEAMDAAAAAGLDFLPGVEISSHFGHHEVHILGLGVDIQDPTLCAALDEQVAARESRAQEIVRRLQELEVPIEWENVAARVPEGAIGRMHIAQEVLALGHAKTVQGVFDKYIKAGRPAYVPKARLAVDVAINLIRGARGVAVLAHPGIGKSERILPQLLEHDFDGIEVYHSRHAPGQESHFFEIAEERGLLVSGGSDCHGTIKGQAPLMGNVRLAQKHVERMREALSERSTNGVN